MIQTCELLKKLRNEDTFLFIVTHDYELIASVCDSIIHIDHGKLLSQYHLDTAGILQLKTFFAQNMRSTQ